MYLYAKVYEMTAGRMMPEDVRALPTLKRAFVLKTAEMVALERIELLQALTATAGAGIGR